MKATHKALGIEVTFKKVKDVLGGELIKVTFPDGSKTTLESKRFNETFETKGN